jgi:organic hydroperoxide reductase OsmC/OhrA
MSIAKGHRFVVALTRQSEDAVLEAAPRPSIRGGAPPEFGGRAEVWSPEHLFVSAVALCFLTTFEFFAKRENLAVTDFTTSAEGTVEKTAKGLAFTGVRLDVHVGVTPGQETRAQELLAMAKRACLVSNSLLCPVELVAETHPAPPLSVAS